MNQLRQWAMSTCVALLLSGWSAFAQEETPKFQFKPIDGMVVITEIKTTETLAIKDGPSRTITRYEKSKQVYTQTETGYKITDTLLEATSSDTSSREYQVLATLKGKSITVSIDQEGKIQSVTGLEPIIAEFRKKMPPSLVGTEVEKALTVEGLTDHAKQGWEREVLAFIGRPAKIGEAWVLQDDLGLFDGSIQKFYVVKKVSGRAMAQGKPCLRIQETANIDPEQLRGFLGSFADTVLTGLKPFPSAATLMIEANYVIDPQTLNVYESKEKQRIEMMLDIPNVGKVPVIGTEINEEKKTYQFPK